MKIRTVLSFILIIGIVIFSGCHKRSKEFKKEVAEIGDAMCRSMEVMNKLKAADPADTLNIQMQRLLSP